MYIEREGQRSQSITLLLYTCRITASCSPQRHGHELYAVHCCPTSGVVAMACTMFHPLPYLHISATLPAIAAAGTLEDSEPFGSGKL